MENITSRSPVVCKGNIFFQACQEQHLTFIKIMAEKDEIYYVWRQKCGIKSAPGVLLQFPERLLLSLINRLDG